MDDEVQNIALHITLAVMRALVHEIGDAASLFSTRNFDQFSGSTPRFSPHRF